MDKGTLYVQISKHFSVVYKWYIRLNLIEHMAFIQRRIKVDATS